MFQVSPGVNFSEVDLTTIVPTVSTTVGVIAGVYRWGPVDQRILIDSENALVNRFGTPSNANYETWFTATSFLAYGNKLYVTRAANTNGNSPIITATVVSGNTVVTTSDTSGLEVGMTALSSNNNSLKVGATIASIINSTAFNISTGSDALANSSSELQFYTNTVFSAIANTGQVANLEFQIVKNEDEFVNKDGNFDSDIFAVARYAGSLGNSLRVSVCASPNAYTQTVNLASYSNASFTININSNTTTFSLSANSSTTAANVATNLRALLAVTDNIEVGNTSIGKQYMKITAISNVVSSGNTSTGNASFTVSFEDPLVLASNFTYDGANTSTRTFNRYWEFFGIVDAAPGQSTYQRNFGNSSVNADELHLVVVDEDGKFTGVPGTILEAYKGVSRATDAKTNDGNINYYKAVIDDQSQYIYIANHLSGAGANTAGNLTSATAAVTSINFIAGNDGQDESNIPHSVLTRAYDLYASGEDIDISLVMVGKSRDFYLANYLIDNIAERRKDCVVFVSPQKGSVVNNKGNEAASIVSFRNNLRSSSYGFLDSGYKYMYDRYNDVYRYVPLNGDMAGLCVRTDTTNDAWWSPGGFNRGQIKNVVKLAYNPRLADRDILYKAGVNPVVTFPGQGTILYGDKTLLAKPSAFDRINVRRLFIVLEKAISTAAKYTLFEFNDDFTRSQFKNAVNPYLRGIKGRRGITDFLVVCDSTNNTPDVIDRNEFVGDIYIKPARSINFIQLNFKAVGTGVAFSEVVGK